MSISISNSPSPAFDAANSYSNSAAQQVQQIVSDSADTVQLTVAQQVAQLYQQGQQVSQIATSLSLTVDSVNSYLGITSAK